MSRVALLGAVVAAAGACAGGPAVPKETANEPPAVSRVADAGAAPGDWREKTASYLDTRAAAWIASPPPISNVPCAMSCHTTFPYLVVRPALGDPAHVVAVRARFEERVAQAKAGTATPFYGRAGSEKARQSLATEAVLDAAALALDDAGAGVPMRETTKAALEVMWKAQRPDGAWDWLDFGLEPWERGDDWGAALVALAVGSIPAETTAGQAAGTAKLLAYVKARLADASRPVALHDRAMMLWANGALAGLLAPSQTDAISEELARAQNADGGFALGAWGRGARIVEDTKKSDGYATALAALALCRGAKGGAARDDVRRALAWLGQSRQPDGSWVGRSVNSPDADNQRFVTDAATAYAALALSRCAK